MECHFLIKRGRSRENKTGIHWALPLLKNLGFLCFYYEHTWCHFGLPFSYSAFIFILLSPFFSLKRWEENEGRRGEERKMEGWGQESKVKREEETSELPTKNRQPKSLINLVRAVTFVCGNSQEKKLALLLFSIWDFHLNSRGTCQPYFKSWKQEHGDSSLLSWTCSLNLRFFSSQKIRQAKKKI